MALDTDDSAKNIIGATLAGIVPVTAGTMMVTIPIWGGWIGTGTGFITGGMLFLFVMHVLVWRISQQ